MLRLKWALAVALAVIAACATSAAATITVPGAGGVISAGGTVSFRGTVISASCVVGAGATVVNGTAASVSSVSFSGCGSGASLSPLGLPWRLAITLSSRTFTISGVQVVITAPVVGVCLYSGNLTGTYTVGARSSLTITGNTLRKVSGGGLCTSAPTVTGTIATENMTTV